MTALAIDQRGYGCGDERTAGAGPYSSRIAEVASKALEHFKRASVNKTLLDVFEEDIERLLAEYNSSDWDGLGSVEISPLAAASAVYFFKRTGAFVEYPELTPEPDGDIALEWYGEAGSILSVSFNDKGEMVYAGSFLNGEKAHGVERVSSEGVEFIKRLIKKTA